MFRHRLMQLCSLLLVVCSLISTAHAQDPKAGASPLSAVQQELGTYQYVSGHSEENAQGYTIESGNLIEPAKGLVEGSVVMVSDKDGAITAIIDRPGRRGTLYINKEGTRHFLEEPPSDYLRPDSVAGIEAPLAPDSAAGATSTGEIDALVMFSTKALEVLDADPVAFALAQLETSNLGLRNSQVAGVKLRLAGVRVTETDLPVDSDGLRAVQHMLTPLRPDYMHDINVAYFQNSPNGGMAYRPGWDSANSIYSPLAFRHEIGHNVGGIHCNADGADNYRFGYQAPGGAHTFMCGNNVPYYSNPQISYSGQPLGNSRTADMARVWREAAARLSGYSPAFQGQRVFMVSRNPDMSATDVAVEHVNGRVGFVALSPEVGPTTLKDLEVPELSILTVKLQGKDGLDYPVNLRGTRYAANCLLTAMNSYADCQPPPYGARTVLSVLYFPHDNPELPAGWYNGVLRLKALSHSQPGWSQDLLISLALGK